MDVHDLIISNSEILGGKPVFKGTRVPVSNLIEYIDFGYTVNDFLLGFPTVKKTQVKQVLNLLSKQTQKLLFNSNLTFTIYED
jgi:uncharacterized protein (DUF433 family)